MRSKWARLVPAAIREDPKLKELRCCLHKLKGTRTEFHVHAHGCKVEQRVLLEGQSRLLCLQGWKPLPLPCSQPVFCYAVNQTVIQVQNQTQPFPSAAAMGVMMMYMSSSSDSMLCSHHAALRCAQYWLLAPNDKLLSGCNQVGLLQIIDPCCS